MSVWDRCADNRLLGVLGAEEVAHLEAYAEDIIRLAEYGLASCTWIPGRTEESGRWVSGDSVQDSRIMAIARRHVSYGAEDWEIASLAPDCLSDAVESARRVLHALPSCRPSTHALTSTAISVVSR